MKISITTISILCLWVSQSIFMNLSSHESVWERSNRGINMGQSKDKEKAHNFEMVAYKRMFPLSTTVTAEGWTMYFTNITRKK